HEVVIADLLREAELLVSLVLFGSADIGAIILHIRQHVVGFAFVIERRDLVRWQLGQQGDLIRGARRDDFKSGGYCEVLLVLEVGGAAYREREKRDRGEAVD